MIANLQISLDRLILALSDALDCTYPTLASHQQRTAYIATKVAYHMGMRGQELIGIFHAAALHDIGLIGTRNRLNGLVGGDLDSVSWHQEIGFLLLHDLPLFAQAAQLICYHHVPWANGAGAHHGGWPVPLGSHILHLADRVERWIDRQALIVKQADPLVRRVCDLAGERFHPACVQAFREVAQAEAFWLDTISDRGAHNLRHELDWPAITVDTFELGPIAEVFARVVDAASPWTAVHSAGVAATAVALAERLHFCEREVAAMRVAGYLHDLGKLTISADILDKPSKLTNDEMSVMRTHTYHTFRILDGIGGLNQIAEWAAFHHERLNGRGYPFHHAAPDLTLGARIMAVADVFTAITEDRPYRAGMSQTRAIAVLDAAVSAESLDGEIVRVLKDGFPEITARRSEEQADYANKQNELRAATQRLGSADEREAVSAGAALN